MNVSEIPITTIMPNSATISLLPTLIAYCNAKERKNYKADFKKAMDKNLASLSQEDRNKRKKEILEAIANKKKTMTMKEYRQMGLDLHDCACEDPFHDHEKKGKKREKTKPSSALAL
ncbi:hypothetical protein HpJP0108_05740 [Helicobacter pylori]|uniref:DUF1104 domain-containing protein n=1 Tax=Helicobacter pylori TaxID=210 RepID=UPI001AAB1942|nr:DUF1104 domain-containing protein [Helicobacter pylori]GHR81164.1 hypothetical protein JP0108_05730 [Helicobacter pylori]